MQQSRNRKFVLFACKMTKHWLNKFSCHRVYIIRYALLMIMQWMLQEFIRVTVFKWPAKNSIYIKLQNKLPHNNKLKNFCSVFWFALPKKLTKTNCNKIFHCVFVNHIQKSIKISYNPLHILCSDWHYPETQKELSIPIS